MHITPLTKPYTLLRPQALKLPAEIIYLKETTRISYLYYTQSMENYHTEKNLNSNHVFMQIAQNRYSYDVFILTPIPELWRLHISAGRPGIWWSMPGFSFVIVLDDFYVPVERHDWLMWFLGTHQPG